MNKSDIIVTNNNNVGMKSPHSQDASQSLDNKRVFFKFDFEVILYATLRCVGH